MKIDRDELAAAAQKFVNEAGRLAGEVNLLLGRIAELGHVYGDDDAGRKAKAAFQRAGENTVGYAGALCNAYGVVGINLALMLSNVDAADWGALAALPKVDMNSVPDFGL